MGSSCFHSAAIFPARIALLPPATGRLPACLVRQPRFIGLARVQPHHHGAQVRFALAAARAHAVAGHGKAKQHASRVRPLARAHQLRDCLPAARHVGRARQREKSCRVPRRPRGRWGSSKRRGAATRGCRRQHLKMSPASASLPASSSHSTALMYICWDTWHEEEGTRAGQGWVGSVGVGPRAGGRAPPRRRQPSPCAVCPPAPHLGLLLLERAGATRRSLCSRPWPALLCVQLCRAAVVRLHVCPHAQLLGRLRRLLQVLGCVPATALPLLPHCRALIAVLGPVDVAALLRQAGSGVRTAVGSSVRQTGGRRVGSAAASMVVLAAP